MTQIKEIIEAENKRNGIEEMRTIRLYREGTFFRAYEWSAWLCCKHVGELKVTNKRLNGIDGTVAFVGFPITSLQKYTPADAQVSVHPDGSASFILARQSIPDEANADELKTNFGEWKSQLPVEESKKKNSPGFGGQHTAALPAPATLTEVMRRILAYPLDSRSPIDNMQFLSELKQQLSALV